MSDPEEMVQVSVTELRQMRDSLLKRRAQVAAELADLDNSIGRIEGLFIAKGWRIDHG